MRTAKAVPPYAVLVLLVVSSALIRVALGSAFVYRWMHSTVTVSPPVVRFVDPGTGVNVSLYNYGTAADVYASAAIDLVLERRSAVFFDTFGTDPRGTRLINLTCPWGYNATAGAVTIYANQSAATTYGGECIAYANVDVSQYAAAGRTIYVAFLVWRSTDGGVFYVNQTHRFDSVYVNTIQQTLYAIGWQNRILSGRTGDAVNSTIYYLYPYTWRGRQLWNWTLLSSTYLGTSNVTEYDFLTYVASAVDFSSWTAIHWFDGGVLTSAAIGPGYRMYPNVVGLGYWWNGTAAPNGTIYFDNLVVTVDAPPWFINVTGLPGGWRVVLRSGTGRVVSESVADSSGLAVLNAAPPPIVDLRVNPGFRDGFIFPNARIEVYDWLGNLVLSKTFDYIVGGDLYRLGFSGNLLRVDSTLVGSSFEAKLVLVDTNCSSVRWWLYLYLVNAAGHYSTPINITAGTIYSRETSIIVMTAGSGGVAGYVYGYAFVPSGSVCEADVELRYSFSGWATYGSLRARLFFRG